MSAPAARVSVREFARLDGCDDKLVRNAIKAGKLEVCGDGKLDPALAGTGWRKRNRQATPGADKRADTPKKSAPGDGDGAVLANLGGLFIDPDHLKDEDFVAAVLAGQFRFIGGAETIKENALAAKHLLAVRKEAGDLVDLEVAETILFDMARSTRDAWMNWPARTAPLIAAELGVPVEPLLEALNKHVQQQLQDIGEPDADFTATGSE